MKWKTAIVLALLLVFLSSSLSVGFGQNTTSDYVALSTTSLTLTGKVGDNQTTTTVTIVGVGNDTVNVKLFPTELHDTSSGKTIPASEMTLSPNDVNLPRNGLARVEVNLTISGTEAGTYHGAIIIAAAIGNGQIAHMNIDVTARIEVVPFTGQALDLFFSQRSNTVFTVLVGVIVFLFLLVLWLGARGESKLPRIIGQRMTIIIVVLTVIALCLWIVVLFNYSFDVLGTIATIVIVPLVGYVTNYLNEKRKDSNEKTKTSQGVNSKGIEKDIETIRTILGELATHYASFKPNLYEESDGKKPVPEVKEENKEFEPLAKAMFIKDGIISRKVWDGVCKQGMMADLPVLELEKYYDYVNLYNQYYSYALKKISSMDQKVFAKDICDETSFFGKFEKFRNDYANLEKVLFVNLTYYLGLFVSTYLYQEEVEYPRVTRSLLKKLLEYGVLAFEDFSKACEREGMTVTDEELRRAHEELKKDLMYTETFDEFKTETQKKYAEELVTEWKMKAAELEKLVEKMYQRDNIPIFYRRVEDDFQGKYNILKSSLTRLESPIFTRQEDILALAEKLGADKPTDYLEALGKLLKANEISQPEYAELKKRIYEKQPPEPKNTDSKQSSCPPP